MANGYERTEAYYRERLAVSGIPEHMHDGLCLYLVERRLPGHFLTAVLSNDLAEACARADAENRDVLYAYVFFLYNYAPGMSWGSPERVREWVAARTTEVARG